MSAATTDDADCLRLQDSRVLFPSDDDDDSSDSYVAPRRKYALIFECLAFLRIVIGTHQVALEIRSGGICALRKQFWAEVLRKDRGLLAGEPAGELDVAAAAAGLLPASRAGALPVQGPVRHATLAVFSSNSNRDSFIFIAFRSEKNWLCEQSHAGLERADVMQYLEVISNTCTEELPNLFNINNGKGRVERIVDIYRANRVTI